MASRSNRIDLVICDGATKIVVRGAVKPLPAFPTYSHALAALEGLARSRTGRQALALAFLPAQTEARRFTNATAALYASGAPADRALAERGLDLLRAVLVGHGRRGRKPSAPLGPDEAARLQTATAAWADRVKPVLVAAAGDRRRQLMGIRALAAGSFAWTPDHDRQVQSLLSGRHVRPARLVDQLVAWQAGTSPRRVRSARGVSLQIVHR